MTAEQTLFLQILADYVQGRPSKFDPSVDEQQFYQLIKAQNVQGIFYVQCRDILPPDSWLRKKLYGGFSSDVFHAVNREKALDKVSRLFDDAGIPFVLFKGLCVARYYLEPRLRTMGDIDLVIRTEDRQAADAVMKGLNCGIHVDNHAVWTYYLDVVTFEIHDHIMYDPLANQFDYRAYFDQIWAYTQEENGRLALKPEFHFLYILTHTAKHIINRGYGIRGFLDLVFFLRGEPDMDWKWLEAQLRELQLLDFAKTCFALCKRWFGVEMPLDPDPVSEDFFASATGKMFRDGLWGHNNEENDLGDPARTARRSSAPYWVVAFKLVLKWIFPPYSVMQLLPWCKFVDGRPWLLPVAWLYNYWYCLLHKRSRVRQLLTQPFTKTKEIHKREAMIDSWGL